MAMKLTYFNARGVIEPTRIMLAIAGVKYEDFRFPIDAATYARPEFEVGPSVQYHCGIMECRPAGGMVEAVRRRKTPTVHLVYAVLRFNT